MLEILKTFFIITIKYTLCFFKNCLSTITIKNTINDFFSYLKVFLKFQIPNFSSKIFFDIELFFKTLLMIF